MILRRLAVTRLPGIREPFEIEAADKGFHIIFGPNAIGKSSICRAVEGLYWEDRGESRQTVVSGEFKWGGAIWRGEREGSTVRWYRGDEGNVSPGFPPSHNYHYFFLHLRDLVDLSPESTSDIALEIRRQMSGGFDLEAIAANFFPPVKQRRRRREREKYNSASNQVQKATVDQANLQGRVDQLEQLKSHLNEAKKAAARLVHVERAIGLANRREKLAGIEGTLSAMPVALVKLTGQERDHVDKQQKRLTTLGERASEHERKLREARAKQKNLGLARPLEKADLATWREKVDDLGRIKLKLEASSIELEGARNKLISALSAVGGNLVDKAALSLPNHAELFELLRDLHRHESRVASIEERLLLLNRVDHSGDDHQDIEELRNAIKALRSWMRVPQPQSLPAKIRARWPWLVAALVMLLTGAGLAWFAADSLSLFAAFGAGIALAALFVGERNGLDDRRSVARSAFEKAGLEEPAAWDASAVQTRLQSLESRAAKLEASAVRARDRDVEREAREAELESLREKEPALDSRRQELGAILGLNELRPDAELVDFARALDHLRLACGEHAAAAGKLQRLESIHTSRLAEVADFLVHHGEPQPSDAAASKARLNRLADRNEQLEKAIAEEQTAKRQLKENTFDRDSTLASIARVYAEAGLDDGDLPGLMSLLAELTQYRELTTQKADLESKIDLDHSELERVGELELAQLDGQTLESLKVELEDIAAQAGQLGDDIADVTVRMKQARRGHALQDLIAAREEARAGLRDLRDQALFTAAGGFLLEKVEQEFERTRMPRVFERARDHFSNFTRHNYELRLEKGNGTSRLFAIELQGRRRRELQELSDGTRAQLLLAARIAFSEQVERGRVLPLFLDEALDQSDPQRFEAIARSLGCLARDQGRQIFYLTSDPLDVDRIRAALDKENCEIASEIDLGRKRNRAASVSGPQELRVAAAPSIPAPAGKTPEEYGALLCVPTFRPAIGSTEQHFYYVLWDDLDLLHDFLQKGIERVGQWQTVSGTPLAAQLSSRFITSADIGSRLDLLSIFCELWIRGRGRPVDKDTLADSGALTARFLGGVVEIARELDGDPERLLGELASRKDQRLKGFRSNSVEQLRNYLIENEYLDDRPVLAESELRLRCMASPAANHLSDGVATECVRRWWEWAGKSLSSGPKSRPE